MIKEYAFWKKSKTKQIPGNLVIDGDSVAFSKDERDIYTSGYEIGGRQYVKKDEYYGKKVDKFVGGLFKKATGEKEDFVLSKSDISGLTVTAAQIPRLDPSKNYQIIKGEFDFTVMLAFSAKGEKYELQFPGSPEDRSKEIESYFS